MWMEYWISENEKFWKETKRTFMLITDGKCALHHLNPKVFAHCILHSVSALRLDPPRGVPRLKSGP